MITNYKAIWQTRISAPASATQSVIH